MNKLLIAVFLLANLPGTLLAQALKPVKWTYKVEQTSKGEAMLVFSADIEKGWHIYSQVTPDGGPLPTVFTFDENKSFERVGDVVEPVPHSEYDSTFEVKVLTLDGKPVFKQKIKLKNPETRITGRIEGQVCKDACIMFGDSFTFNVGPFKD